jgi:hypothetical protein
MKKIIPAILVLFCMSVTLPAQSFGAGQMFVDAGIGLGFQHYQYTDLATNTKSPRDTSAALEIPFGFEYGILPFLGGKLDFNYAKYLQDSANNTNPRSFDVVPTVTVHAPLGLDKLDIYGSLGYGFAHFADEDGTVKARANGSVFNFGLCLRFLFSDDGHVGMQFWYKHSQYNFKKGELSDNLGNSIDFALDGPGNNFGIGFYGRFGN